MPGWIFVSLLLAAAALLAAVAGRPVELVAFLAVMTLVSAVAGALRRPDRHAEGPVDDAPRSAHDAI